MGTVQLHQMSNSFAYSCQTRSAVGGAKFQWIGEKTNSSGSSKLGQPIRSSIDQFPTLDSKKIKISNDLWGQKLGDFERKKFPSLTERCHQSITTPTKQTYMKSKCAWSEEIILVNSLSTEGLQSKGRNPKKNALSFGHSGGHPSQIDFDTF